MKGKHAKNTANKLKLAKRTLALCFAVVFLCSCMLPVFATGSSLTDVLREAVEETAASAADTTESSGGTMMDSFQSYYASYTAEYKTTYRFWLSEKDSYALPDTATTAASDLEQYDDFYKVVTIKENTTLTAPDGFKNPTDPTGEGRKFEGWYYIDTYGLTQTFKFDGSSVLLDKSSTIDVFAKWGEAPAEEPAEDEDKTTEDTEEPKATVKSDDTEESEDESVDLDLDNVEAKYQMDGDDSDIALLAISPSGSPQKTVSVGGTVSVKSNNGTNNRNNHTWTSSDTSIATVAGSGANAVITGVKAGVVVITHKYTYNYGGTRYTTTDTVKIQVTGKYDSEAYFLYCYTLIPGKMASSSGNADSIWNGMGVGSVSGLGAPNSYNTNVVLDNGYGSSGATITYPNEYPDITVDGKTYKYASDDSENRYKEGYYTIQWFRVVRDGGANTGNNSYNPTVSADYPTYHLDGQITLNQKDMYTVDFKLKDAGSSTFELVDAPTYSKRVPKGTAASTLKVPTTNDTTNYPQTKKVGNTWYDFDGWYLDEECTEKVDFSSYVINANTTFYGRYVPSNTVTEDDPYINVEKRFVGLPEGKLPKDFRIEVGGTYLYGHSADKTVDSATGDIIYRWTIDNVDAGNYKVKEVGEKVNGYDVVTTVNGTEVASGAEATVTVTGSTFNVETVKEIDSCANLDLDVGVQGDYNFIFVVSETGNNKKNVVISKEPLSLSERAAVKEALTKAGSNFANNRTTVFYSIKENTKITIERTEVEYSGGQIHIANSYQWNKALQLKYSVEAGSNAEVKVVNTYTSNQADLTVTKTVTGNIADLDQKFTFEMTIQKDGVAVDPEDIEWMKGTVYGDLNDLYTGSDGKYAFDLKNGENIVFSGIPANADVTVTETDAEDYKTTAEVKKTAGGEVIVSNEDSKTASVKIDVIAKTIAFTNDKDIPVNTGVILDTLPYILMLAAVGGGAIAFFLRKRHHDDED